MKLEIISRNGEEVRVRVEADAQEMDKAFTDGLDAFVVQNNLDSLAGETSMEKLQNALSEDEAKQAIYTAVMNYLVPFAISEFGQAPLATYGIESDETPETGKPYTFEMTILEKPHYELTDYEPLTVKIDPKPSVQEEDIDQQLQMLASQMVASQQNIDPNSPEVELPEITDEWVAQNLKDSDIHTVSELRQRLHATSEEELATRYEQAKMAAAMEAYRDRFTGTVSKKMLDAMTQELYETFLAELASEGMTFEDFAGQHDFTEDTVRASLSKQAENQLIQGFILDAIFDHEALVLEPSDLIAVMRNIAPGREEETLEAMRKSGRSFLLRQSAARMKAVNWIMQNTTFVSE